MSKRLELIKKKFERTEKAYPKTLYTVDVKWLIEQAEQVENYKKACKQWEVTFGYERDQNKRYREAIEKSLKRIEVDVSYDQLQYDVEGILLKALEGDPHESS